ncbi:MAG: polysaccharide deacetylase family protein, partial [Chryseobacterium sp.]
MVLLSFDIEEFDMPFEYKGEISFEKQISISQNGLERILDILKKYNAKATFFSTVIFAENSKHLIKRLLIEGHELASHTWFHSEFEEKHLKES